MKKTAIFLDFDGTTLPIIYEKFLIQMNLLTKGSLSGKDKYGFHFLPEIMNNIKIITDKFNSDIIITSTWRNDFGLDGMKQMWTDRGYGGKVIGITKNIDINKRGSEINIFLNHNHYDNYVIIDDMNQRFFLPSQESHLVICEPNFGFDSNKLKEAIEILEK